MKVAIDARALLPQATGIGTYTRAIARALAVEPEIILADEPTGNLDTATGDTILALLHDLNREGTTMVVITHDMTLAKRASRVVEVRDGRIISDGSRGAVDQG